MAYSQLTGSLCMKFHGYMISSSQPFSSKNKKFKESKLKIQGRSHEFNFQGVSKDCGNPVQRKQRPCKVGQDS